MTLPPKQTAQEGMKTQGSLTLGALSRHATQCMAQTAKSQGRPADPDVLERRGKALVQLALGLSPLEWVCRLQDPTAPPPSLLKALCHPDLDWAPLSRLVGHTVFCGHRFALGPDTLDPRWESEGLVHLVLKTSLDKDGPIDPRSGLRILDLGSGSGCLLISLLLALPDAVGVGTDSAPKALEMAAANASTLGIDGRAQWCLGDWYEALDAQRLDQKANWHKPPQAPGFFDVILSNPPYIPQGTTLEPEVTQWDPPLALYGGQDGLQAYRQILHNAPRFLAPRGLVALEIGHDQGSAVCALARQAGMLAPTVHQDSDGKDRYVLAWNNQDRQAV
jgi:release factor glutamine methyltransferase